MDYRALAELVMFSLLGLSVLAVAIGFSIRAFLAPTLRELFAKAPKDDRLLAARITQMEDRLDSIDESLARLADKSDFDRRLAAPDQADAERRLEGPKLS